MLEFGIIDGIIPEPDGGAHWDYAEAANHVKSTILNAIRELSAIDPTTRIEQRIEKYGKMGFWEEK